MRNIKWFVLFWIIVFAAANACDSDNSSQVAEKAPIVEDSHIENQQTPK